MMNNWPLPTYKTKSKPFESVPQQVWDSLVWDIAVEGLEYADNFRAYRFEDNFLFDDYIKAANLGCCGVFEGDCTVDGNRWIYGCNHGH